MTTVTIPVILDFVYDYMFNYTSLSILLISLGALFFVFDYRLLAVLLSTGAVLFIISFPSFIVVLLAFAGGCGLTYFLAMPESRLVKLLAARYSRKPRPVQQETLRQQECPVCGTGTCKRHKPTLTLQARQPWAGLELPQRIDMAVQEILDHVFDNYVYTWYKRDVSSDEAFVDELRTTLRYIISVILRRIRSVDLSVLVTDHVMEQGMKHVEVYMEGLKDKSEDETPQAAAIRAFGGDLHVAVRSRAAEQDYIRNLLQRLFTVVLPPTLKHPQGVLDLGREILTRFVVLPVMDTAANPDIVNNLVLIALDQTPSPEYKGPSSPEVTFLELFATPRCKTQSVLHKTVNDVLTDSLYPFMQFMKREGSINVLQFCLDVDQLIAELQSPDLSDEQAHGLHETANTVFTTYFDSKSKDRIHFQPDLIQELKAVMEGPAREVERLRNRTTCLFDARDHVHRLLKHTFLPLFHHSDEYYNCICGDRNAPVQPLTRTYSIRGKRPDAQKPKPAGLTLTARVEEGVTEAAVEAEEDIVTEGAVRDGEVGEVALEGTSHDLSTWRVTVPTVIPIPDPENRKNKIFAFMVESRRVDSEENSGIAATVARRIGEFYSLDGRLREFHGDSLTSVTLPQRPPSPKARSVEYLLSRTADYETYLQHLLTQPALRRSELLYAFLSVSDFTASLSKGIGNVFKQVPLKFVKEKGQHLETFLASFLASCELPKPRPGKRQEGATARQISDERLKNSLLDDNAGVGFRLMPEAGQDLDAPPKVYTYDMIMYILNRVFKVQRHCLWLGLGVGAFCRDLVQNFMLNFVEQKIEKVLQEQRLVKIINLLRDALFYDKDPPRTDEDKEMRKKQAFQALIDFIPSLATFVTEDAARMQGCEHLFSMLQQPVLNKQLAYVLLDTVLQELFPELKDTKAPEDEAEDSSTEDKDQ